MTDRLKTENIEELASQFYAGKLSLNEEARNFNKGELVELLRKGTSELSALTGEMSSAQLAYRLSGAPGGPDDSGDERHFDTSEIVTHVVSGLTFHWYNIAKALGHERPTMNRPPEGAAVTGKKRTAMGSGGWSGLTSSELKSLLDQTSERFLAYLESLPDELDEERTARFGIFGEMNAKGWLLLAAVHPTMHAIQVRTMKAQPDFPRS